jgi:hypothetical protein
LLIIERKDALKWGYDPHTVGLKDSTKNAEKGEAETVQETGSTEDRDRKEKPAPVNPELLSPPHTSGQAETAESSPGTTTAPSPAPTIAPKPTPTPQRISLLGVVVRLGRSPRALTSVFNTLLYG